MQTSSQSEDPFNPKERLLNSHLLHSRDSVGIAKDRLDHHHHKHPPNEMTRLLEDSNLIANDTITIGYNSIEHMESQKEVLDRSRRNVESTSSMSDRVSVLLNDIEMWSQARVVYLYTVMVLLFIVNVGVVYRLVTNEGNLL
jgi:Snare region anchored in the vesicle membrane C-terminus